MLEALHADMLAELERLNRWRSTHAPRIDALEGLLRAAQHQAHAGREAIVSLTSERAANAALTAECEAAEQREAGLGACPFCGVVGGYVLADGSTAEENWAESFRPTYARRTTCCATCRAAAFPATRLRALPRRPPKSSSIQQVSPACCGEFFALFRPDRPNTLRLTMSRVSQ
jgi:hypothetical protein